MGIKRYELSEAQWVRIAPMLPGKVSDPGRTALDNRLFVNGVLWVLRSGARWSDLPGRYGKYKTVHKRFTRWARAGVRTPRLRPGPVRQPRPQQHDDRGPDRAQPRLPDR